MLALGGCDGPPPPAHARVPEPTEALRPEAYDEAFDALLREPDVDAAAIVQRFTRGKDAEADSPEA